MTCESCLEQFHYCFYINDEFWLRAVGKKEGRWCAHCILEKCGGLEWYIIWNQPAAKMNVNSFHCLMDDCPLCNGSACELCGYDPESVAACPHDIQLRHYGQGPFYLQA